MVDWDDGEEPERQSRPIERKPREQTGGLEILILIRLLPTYTYQRCIISPACEMQEQEKVRRVWVSVHDAITLKLWHFVPALLGQDKILHIARPDQTDYAWFINPRTGKT